MTKIEGSYPGSGSESGSISQRHGSADPDQDPDPPQNVTDPQHGFCTWLFSNEINHDESDLQLWVLERNWRHFCTQEKPQGLRRPIIEGSIINLNTTANVPHGAPFIALLSRNWGTCTLFSG